MCYEDRNDKMSYHVMRRAWTLLFCTQYYLELVRISSGKVRIDDVSGDDGSLAFGTRRGLR